MRKTLPNIMQDLLHLHYVLHDLSPNWNDTELPINHTCAIIIKDFYGAEVKMTKVVVGMSGGVDSAVAAYLLKQQGFEVTGVTLRTLGSESADEEDARHTCELLGIEFLSYDCSTEFRECVIDPFINSYLKGKTPNPCIECNRYIKFAMLEKAAAQIGAEKIATGHYAYLEKLENGRYTVRKASQNVKDQTYMLYKLTQEQLAGTILPLGSFTKDEIRAMAESAGLDIAHKGDSQDICFIPDGKHAQFIEENTNRTTDGEGYFVDEAGNILGKHGGIWNYTVGQRKGLGIALGYPAFVLKICPEDNTVVLGSESSVMCSSFVCDEVNYLSIDVPDPGTNIRCKVKARYHQPERTATIEALEDGCVRVTLDEPVKGVAPGQSAVFYDEEGRVIGGGVIRK